MDFRLEEKLRTQFGFDAFRPGQREAIEALLRERRVLCIQPTGYGKSLLYQLPATLLEGVTLVISPLLALMRDQLGHLENRFNISSGSINTDQDEVENESVRRRARSGQLRILFVAPEQLDNLDTFSFIQSLPISLIVVDEAHCISAWGHDFRPSYRQIVHAIRELEANRADLHVLGLTATADARTESDIAAQLVGPTGAPLKVLRSSMDRPNIALGVRAVAGLHEKLPILDQLLRDTEGSAILYCATREQTEIVAEYLTGCRHDCVSYHAGYDPGRKRELQQAFISGGHRAIAATNALGMGIDKPNIRLIVHVDLPGSITAYYQEVGRAGRDGLPSRGILLYDKVDRRIQDHFIRSAQPTEQDFFAVLASLQTDATGSWPSLMNIKVRSGLHPTRVTVILAELAEQGFAEKIKQGARQVYRPTGKKGAPDLARYQLRGQVRNRELASMLAYGEGRVDCLMATLRHALGDNGAEHCGRCSLCDPDHWRFPRPSRQEEAQHWLGDREVIISASKQPPMSEGLALLNGDLRPPLFVRFMKGRAGKNEQIEDELKKILADRLDRLAKKHRFSAVLAVPSRTWSQREDTARFIAERLGVRLDLNTLAWRPEPKSRQGQLTNNDQRKLNVQGRMSLPGGPYNPGGGAILLLDDYIGSLATLRECTRCLRRTGGFKGDIVALAIARIRWRLGATGMI